MIYDFLIIVTIRNKVQNCDKKGIYSITILSWVGYSRFKVKNNPVLL